jgi:predicted dienelactone hydrolase
VRVRPSILIGVAALLALSACSSARPNAAGSTTTVAPRSGCLPSGETANSTKGPYAVDQTLVTFVDNSRPTQAAPERGLPARPNRTLPALIVYPRAKGRFPLVEFSHGVISNGPEHAAMLQTWARAGYVAVAPTFPLSSGPNGRINDIVNQPGDVSFVLTSVLKMARAASGPIAGRVAIDCVAVSGHSLGAATTLDVAYNSCCRDNRIKAVIEMSGVLVPINGGNFDTPPATPLLLLHGDNDTVVPIKDSQVAFARLHGDRYFITFHGGNHVSIFAGTDGELMQRAILAFLDAKLKGERTALDGLAATVSASGVASYQTAS